MATLPHSLHFSFPTFHTSSKLSQSHLTQNLPFASISLTHLTHLKGPIKQTRFILKATDNNGAPTDEDPDNQHKRSSEEEESSGLGTEIKKAIKEREKGEDSDGIGGFLSGVVEEIGQIEWPEFGKVIGTTGVVLGVIAGSSVVLLTVNGVLAELSDQVFAGKGVQDFFGG
ncbi:hypothetical protein BVRB_5g124050 [Beta vulgaris subsp. vulgaris]|uniref:Preprotein translocase subunit SECE1 n=1 Tax=Beta vulgaris subsp. vulgaris TaxID=3555 RepID=A0A0J8BCT4_BETVV|nr:hypothetical protein BVRB_5g124050 [Beta vulgaris subsp. vulgaris]